MNVHLDQLLCECVECLLSDIGDLDAESGYLDLNLVCNFFGAWVKAHVQFVETDFVCLY